MVAHGVTPTSFHLTEEDRKMLAELAESTGLSRSAVIRLALQQMHAADTDRRRRLLDISDEIRVLA